MCTHIVVSSKMQDLGVSGSATGATETKPSTALGWVGQAQRHDLPRGAALALHAKSYVDMGDTALDEYTA